MQTSDNRNHYVYLLESKVEEKWYIGVRSCSCPIGEDKYMGSSRVMTKEDKANCRKIVLKRFKTRKEAVAYEIELHNKFDVVNNIQFWNQAKQTSTGFDTTGRIMSEEERQRRSKALMGHKGSTHWKGKKLPQSTKDKMSKAAKGVPKSKQHKQALKDAHKTREYKGYDSTVYIFYHKEHGSVKCTQYELYKKYPDIQKSNLNRLIKGVCKQHKGWRIDE